MSMSVADINRERLVNEYLNRPIVVAEPERNNGGGCLPASRAASLCDLDGSPSDGTFDQRHRVFDAHVEEVLGI